MRRRFRTQPQIASAIGGLFLIVGSVCTGIGQKYDALWVLGMVLFGISLAFNVAGAWLYWGPGARRQKHAAKAEPLSVETLDN